MNIAEINYKDRSEFLRGFATIIRKNNCGNLDEKNVLNNWEVFWFEKEFCENSLEHLVINKYILEEPAVFSAKPVAEFFVNDVAKIMSQFCSKPKADEPSGQMSDASKEWLRKTAEANQLDFLIKELIEK